MDLAECGMLRRRGVQQDYVLKLIQEAGEVLARLRAKLLGTESKPEALRADAALAIRALLGDDASLLALLDADTAVRIAGSPERVALWAALLDVEAEAARSCGDAQYAESRHARANALRAAAAALEAED